VRLAFVAPLAESVPPRRYGGTERVVSWLVEELVRRGHDVTLFASGDSRTGARLVPMAPKALRLAGVNDHGPYHLIELGEVFRRGTEFDLVHSHLDYLAFPFTRLSPTPVVHTLHGRLDLAWLPDIYRRYPELHLISISDAQRAPLPGVRFDATVHHGLPRDLLTFRVRPDDYFLFLGRVSPEKGPVLAVQAARAAGVRLVIAAKVDPMDRAFYEREVEPLLDPPRIEYVGEVDDREKDELLGGARGLLLPIDWPTLRPHFIEAMACGSPVITRPCGSVPEIVSPGRHGCVASTLDRARRRDPRRRAHRSRQLPRRVRAALHRRAHDGRLRARLSRLLPATAVEGGRSCRMSR
jgi:glycosyltransferase involved in cell wall biosynthesis